MALKAKYEGKCNLCPQPVHVGEQINRNGEGWAHARCMYAAASVGVF